MRHRPQSASLSLHPEKSPKLGAVGILHTLFVALFRVSGQAGRTNLTSEPMSEASEFLGALAPSLAKDERIILCAFPGDPHQAKPQSWRPKPWLPGGKVRLPGNWNAYVTISSFRAAPDGSWRRRKDLFASGRALMVDDVGTKVDPTAVRIPASAIIETSPGNTQHWYFLDPAESDSARFDALIRSFIDGKLLGQDPGMAGITRVGRLPGFLNGKPEYGGFTTRTVALTDRTYALEDLVSNFGLTLRGRNVGMPSVATDESLRRNRAFVDIYNFLQAHGMLKRGEPDMAGWTEMTCPWVHEHTGGADNGAAIREPNPENGYWGAFRCHHGSHAHKAWRDLCEMVAELAAEELETANTSPFQNK